MSELQKKLLEARKRGEELRLDRISRALNKINSMQHADYADVFPELTELEDCNFNLGDEMWKFQGTPLFSHISLFLQR